jgi:hypothetical protein
VTTELDTRGPSHAKIDKEYGRSERAFAALCNATEAELRRIFKESAKPDAKQLAGWAFKGRNVGPIPKAAGIERFVKCFFELEGSVEVEGCNLWVRPFGAGRNWELANRPPHGFYVVRTEWQPSWGPSQKNAVMIDYAASLRNHRLNPERLIDDYLVQPDPDDPHVYLGKAFIGLGGLKVFSNYFVLLRHPDSQEVFERFLSGLPLRKG